MSNFDDYPDLSAEGEIAEPEPISSYKPLTPAEIEEAERLCKEATPGPWDVIKAQGFCDKVGVCPHGRTTEGTECESCEDWCWTRAAFIGAALTLDCGDYEGMNNADAKFCAASRTLLPRLLAQVKRLTEVEKSYLNLNREKAKSDTSTIKTLLTNERDLDRITADRDEQKRRAEAAEADISDMLYEATFLIDNALCSWCDRFDNQHELCCARDCKAEHKWRGHCAENTEDKPEGWPCGRLSSE